MMSLTAKKLVLQQIFKCLYVDFKQNVSNKSIYTLQIYTLQLVPMKVGGNTNQAFSGAQVSQSVRLWFCP